MHHGFRRNGVYAYVLEIYAGFTNIRCTKPYPTLPHLNPHQNFTAANHSLLGTNQSAYR